jgi:hypothetical protein
VGNGNVYWTSNVGNAIRVVPIGGGTPQSLYPASAPSGIAVDATDVYWSNDGTHQIMKAAVAGGGTPAVFWGDQTWLSSPLLIDATNVYLSDDYTFSPGEDQPVPVAVNKSTGAPLLYSQFTSVGISFYDSFAHLALNSTTVFSIEDAQQLNDDVNRPKAQYKSGVGGPPMYVPNIYVGLGGGMTGATADDCSFFWTGWSPPVGVAAPNITSTPGIFSVLANVPSNQVTWLTTAVTSPTVIVVDGAYVYWLDATWIGRVAR